MSANFQVSRIPKLQFTSNVSIYISIQSWVSMPFSNTSKKSNFDVPIRVSFNGPKNGKVFSNRKEKFLGNFREKLFAEGIPKNAAELITGVRGRSTVIHDKSSWLTWDSKCSTEQVDPIVSLCTKMEYNCRLWIFNIGLP